MICTRCLSGYNLTTTTNRCVEIPCPFGEAWNIQANQCAQRVCSDPNCQVCLYDSNVCTGCNPNSGSILAFGECHVISSLPAIRTQAQNTATALSVPGVRFFVKPIQPFFAFLDDYWYYIYHNRNYSISVKIVFDSIKFIN